MNPWTEPIVDRLKMLWADKLSCSRCAVELNAEFGTHFERNAVIGKVHRLGLAGRPRTGAQSGGTRKRIRRGVMSALIRPPSPQSGPPLAPVLEPPADVRMPRMRPCSLMELSDARCRFPIGHVGDSDFHFCGAAPFESKPYCPGHCRMAYQPGTAINRTVRPRV